MNSVFSCPCALKIGPGCGSFGIALDKRLDIKIDSVTDTEEQGGVKVIKSPFGFLDRNTLESIGDKIYQYFQKNLSLIHKTIEVTMDGEYGFFDFLNQKTALSVLFIRAVSEIYGLPTDTDDILTAFQANSDELECAAASLLGGMTVADKSQNTYLCLDWNEDWKFNVIYVRKAGRKCKSIVPTVEEYQDSVAKSALFITSVSMADTSEEDSREIMYRTFLDRLSYRQNKNRIPFIEKLNIIGRTGGLSGMGFLKDDAGVILTGEDTCLEKCTSKINHLYDRNSVVYSNHSFSVSRRGMICTE